MRALHSPMLQYGISTTANLHVELVTSHDDKNDSACVYNLIALSDPDLGTGRSYYKPPLPRPHCTD